MNEKLNWFRNCVEHKLVNFKVGGVQERIGYELQNWVLVILKVSLRCKTCSYIYMRDATSTTILQHFYNKSQVVSCYWFEFETNSKITFLSQQ